MATSAYQEIIESKLIRNASQGKNNKRGRAYLDLSQDTGKRQQQPRLYDSEARLVPVPFLLAATPACQALVSEEKLHSC